MMKRTMDDYGREISSGDNIRLTVGMPGREVVASVKMRGRTMVIENDEGRMSLAEALRYYPIEKIVE